MLSAAVLESPRREKRCVPGELVEKTYEPLPVQAETISRFPAVVPVCVMLSAVARWRPPSAASRIR
jgi:hypothetical protein